MIKFPLVRKIILGSYKRQKIEACLIFIDLDYALYRNPAKIYTGNPVDNKKNMDLYEGGFYSNIEFDLLSIPNGFYEYKESLGYRKSQSGYLEIKNGEILAQWATWEQFRNAIDHLIKQK